MTELIDDIERLELDLCNALDLDHREFVQLRAALCSAMLCELGNRKRAEAARIMGIVAEALHVCSRMVAGEIDHVELVEAGEHVDLALDLASRIPRKVADHFPGIGGGDIVIASVIAAWIAERFEGGAN